MPRELIIESRQRLGESLDSVYMAGGNIVIGELMERWSKGAPCPHPEARILNVHLHDAEGNHVGFRFYLSWGEAIPMGNAPVEVIEPDEG